MKKAMIITVGTGKEGKDIANAIRFSIRQQNPDYIVFLLTSVSEEKTMPFILEDSFIQNIGEDKINKIKLDNPDDVQEIATKCDKIIKDLISSFGISPINIVADYTSGTKAMSAGLAFAAINNRIGSIVYVTGQRAEDGRVITGSEKSVVLQPNIITVERMIEDSIRLFNTYQFESSLSILKEAKNILQIPQYIEKIDFLTKLNSAYNKWDKFQLNEAFDELRAIKKSSFLEEFGIKDHVKRNLEALHKERENIFCFERMVDLFENARRRGDGEGKYDDAVARLYRLLEYIAQYEIFKRNLYPIDKNGNIDTSDIKISKLSPTFREKYEKYRNQDGKISLGLRSSFELLKDLDNPLGKEFFNEIDMVNKFMGLRNRSILAHGFNPLREKSYKEMSLWIEAIIKKTLIKGFDDLRKKVTFPKL